jgi:amidohydrolase
VTNLRTSASATLTAVTSSPKPLPPVRASVEAIAPAAIALRRDLHEHAELSTQETRTQSVILERLRAAGLDDVREIADTGVTALVRGARPGPNLLWRADIDALPLDEDTGLPFACPTGAMHACAHDELVQRSRSSLAGTVRFAFQPAEERIGGSRRMIDAGVMDDPRVERVFGLHLWAPARTGELLVKPGPVFAAATHFRIIVRGRGGHAAAPHETVDPVIVAAHVVVALQTVVSRSLPPSETAVVTVGRLEAGKRGNIIPEEAMMSGTLRTFERETRERALRRMDEIAQGVAAAFGATCQFDHSTLEACVNDVDAAALVARVAREFLGEHNVREAQVTGGDDMAYFLQAARGAYFMLGATRRNAERAYPHHHPRFDFDEAAIPLGIELGLRIIEEASGSGLSLATTRVGRPITIADYDPDWPARFQAERRAIFDACPGPFVEIEHVGSTSVPGLAAKPIIDLMPGARSLDDITPAVIAGLASLGYEYVPEVERDIAGVWTGTPERRYFRKDVDGERAFHMHIVQTNSDWWRDHLLFRDYLRRHPETAADYAALKRRLAQRYNEEDLPRGINGNVGYTEQKTEFVERVLAIARAEGA